MTERVSHMPMVDEVEFQDHRSHRPGTVLLRAPEGGRLAVEIEIVATPGLHFTVSLDDARRIGQALSEAADELAADGVAPKD